MIFFGEYLSFIEVKTCVIEPDYIDKDYLIDYSKFYARSFEDFSRKTDRLHFFSLQFDQSKFYSALEMNDEKFLEALKESYLGFIVRKPIKDQLGHRLIGRTLLATYPKNDPSTGEERVYLKNEHQVSLFGTDLEIESLPFQQKDLGVCACATVTCWSSLFPLMNLFGIPTLSPFEITERSTVLPTDARNFPSEGLTLFQMKEYYSSMGLEAEFIDPHATIPGEDIEKPDIVADVVRAYIELGLPVIAALNVEEESENIDYHAALITGYRHKHGEIKEIYIHDDNIGPYHHIRPNDAGRFYSWTETMPDGSSLNFKVCRLVVPIYPKIRLSFTRIYDIYLHYRRQSKIQIQSGNIPKDSRTELFLTNIRRYKKDLLRYNFDKKIDRILDPAPRFLWVIRIQSKGVPIFDYIHDGTSVICDPKRTKDIHFKP